MQLWAADCLPLEAEWEKRRKKARLCNLGLAGSGHNVQPCRSQWKIVGGTRRLAHCPAGGLQPRGDPMRCNCTRRKKGKKMTCRFSVPSCNFITKSHSLEGRLEWLQILFLISGKHIWSRNEAEIIEATRDVYGLKTRVKSLRFLLLVKGELVRASWFVLSFALCQGVRLLIRHHLICIKDHLWCRKKSPPVAGDFKKIFSLSV